jgi:hypothetical protein
MELALVQDATVRPAEVRCQTGFVPFRGNCVARDRVIGPHDERCDPPCEGDAVCSDGAQCRSPKRDAPPPTSDGSDEQHYQAGGRLGFGAGFAHGVYTTVQVDGAYRVHPLVLVGGAFEAAAGGPTDDYCADGGWCAPNYVAIGPRIELQASPDWVFSPWIGAGLAVDNLRPSRASLDVEYRSFAFETTWDVGLDVRPTHHLSIGPCAAMKFFLTDPYERLPVPYGDANRIIFLEIRVAWRF